MTSEDLRQLRVAFLFSTATTLAFLYALMITGHIPTGVLLP